MTGLLRSWFGDLGIPRVALRGYSSQTLVDDVAEEVLGARGGDRPSVLIYCGDLDPSGVDIERDFGERTGCFDEVILVAVTEGQIDELGLIVAAAKSGDSRGRRTGVKVQVAVEAIPPDQLREMIQAKIDLYWDPRPHEAVRRAETEERASLAL